MNSSFLVDDKGEVHLGDRHVSEAAFGEDADEAALGGIEHDGRVEWGVCDRYVRVRLRPSIVSPAAYARLMDWLEATRPARILLAAHIHGEWDYEFFRDPQAAARRVRDLVEACGGGRTCNLRRRPCSPRALIPDRNVQRALAYWREHRHQFQAAQALRVLGPLLRERWVLYASLPQGGFAVTEFGAYHTDHVRRYLTARKGTRLSEADPDSFLSRACAQVYRNVLGSFEPNAEELDAVAYWPGFGRVRSRYRRLMLPFKSPAGCCLLSGICLDSGIDLLE